MYKYSRHIAWLLILIFALFGAEKLDFSEVQSCDKKITFCPKANMYVYTSFNTKTLGKPDSQSDIDSCKVPNVFCETFFIKQVEHFIDNKQTLSFNYSEFYYKLVIHSTPYIPIIDPPPIV